MDHKIVITRNGGKTRIEIRTSKEVSNDTEQAILDSEALNSLGEAIKEILKRKAKKGDALIEEVAPSYLSILSRHLTDDLAKSAGVLLAAFGEKVQELGVDPLFLKVVLKEFYSDCVKAYKEENRS